MKTNKILLTIVTGLFTSILTAQVGVGTTAPAATADITALNPTGNSTNVDGLLIPRVERRRARLMASVPTSTLIYVNSLNSTQTGQAINIDAVGFYYFDGSVWQKLTTTNNNWSLTGNTGTTPATNFLGTTDTQPLVIRTNNTEKIRVNSNGKVGIGEPNPTDATLEINGNAIIGNSFTGGNAVAQTGGLTVEGRTIIGEDDFYYGIDKVVVYGNTNWIPTAVTNGDNTNGLTYAVNGYTSDGVCIYGEDNDGGIGVSANVSGTNTNRPTGVNGYDISGRGYGVVGISNDSPATRGWIGVQGIESTTTNFAVLSAGDFGYTAGIVNLSDVRLKKNIKPLNNALGLIEQINPKTYDMKWEEYKTMGLSREPQMGFIAQELETILPSLVSDKKMPLNDNIYSKEELKQNPELSKKQGNDIDVKMVNYVQMVPLLTQAIKEQQEIIKSLEARIKKLEEK